MKRTLTTMLLLVLAACAFSQDFSKNKDYYLHKSKKQKTTGWILLGGGFATTFVGLTQWNFAGYEEEDADKQKIGSVLIFTGLAGMIASIPVFSASKRNKKKAMSLSFKEIRIPQIKNSSMVYRPIPAVSLKINL